MRCGAFGVHRFPSGRHQLSFSCGRACRRQCTQSKSNGVSVERSKQMASAQFSSLGKHSWGLLTSHFVMRQITAVSMMMDFIIPWLMTRTVIYPHDWSCLPALHCAMLSRSGKGTKVLLWKLPRQSRMWTDLIARTTSTPRMKVVRIHPAALPQVTWC